MPDVINTEHLADGIHPGDEGHKRIAAAVGKALTTAIRYAEDGVVPEILTETPNFGMTVITGGRTDSDDTDELPVVADEDVEVEAPPEVESEERVADEDAGLEAEASLS